MGVFLQKCGYLRGLQLEIHFSCLLPHFLLHKEENGNYFITRMDYLQIRTYIHWSNLFEEWPLLLGQFSCFHMQSIDLTGSLHGHIPWLEHHLQHLGCTKCPSCGDVNLIILWDVAFDSCWGHRSHMDPLPTAGQGTKELPCPRSLFREGNQLWRKAWCRVAENTYDSFHQGFCNSLAD